MHYVIVIRKGRGPKSPGGCNHHVDSIHVIHGLETLHINTYVTTLPARDSFSRRLIEIALH